MSVKVKKGKGGTTKTALQRANHCMEFRKCSVEVRETFTNCSIKAMGAKSDAAFESAMQACGDAAAASCSSGGSAKPATKKPATKKK